MATGVNPFGGGSSSSRSPFPSAPIKGPSHPHGVLGLFQNFGNDVKGAVEGFVPGVVHLAEHPIGGIEQMAKGTWTTWSPLFHGEFTKFGAGLYAHPLAPLLDLAAVASGGLTAASTLGKLGEFSDASLLGKAAKLTEPKTVRIYDKGISEGGKGRGFVEHQLSTRPLRRLTQEHFLPHITSKLPAHTQEMLRQGKFERLHAGDMARRAVAVETVKRSLLDASAKAEAIGAARAGQMKILDAAMLSGKALVDPTTSARVRSELAAFAHLNLAANAPMRLAPEEAVKFLKEHPHFVPVKSAALVDMTHYKLLHQLQRKEARLQTRALQHAELAHGVEKIRTELAHHNATLREMHDKGYLFTGGPAKTKLAEPTTKQLISQRAVPVKEVEANVKRLESQLNKAHNAKMIHDATVRELADVKAQRMALEHRSHAEKYARIGASEESFNHYAETLGRHTTVSIGRGRSEAQIRRALSRAWVGMDGKIPIVPRHDATMMGHELRNSTGFLTKLVRNTTGVWKSIQVKFTPRTLTNNTVGNHIIYAMRMLHPVHATRAMMHAVRLIHTAPDTESILMRATPWRSKSWVFQHFSPELHNTFGRGVLGPEGKPSTSRIARVLKGPGFYGLVQKFADEPTRLASIISYVHGDPQVVALAHELMAKAEARGAQLSRTDALDKAAARVLHRNHDLRTRAAEFGRSVAGDYLSMTPREQKIKDWVPFYLWDRHIVKSTSNLVKDTPGRALFMQQLSNMGDQQVKKYLGAVPEFLQNSLPLNMLGIGPKAGDRADVLLTHSLNPFGTVGELAGLTQAVTVGGNKQMGSDLFSQINPLATDAIQYGTGTSLLTGAPMPRHGGLVTSILANLGTNLPEAQMVKAALTKPTTLTPKGKEKLYAVDHRSSISSFLGVPVRNVSKSAANAMADKEAGVKKGRSSRRKNPFS